MKYANISYQVFLKVMNKWPFEHKLNQELFIP